MRVGEEQAGYRPGNACIDQILILRNNPTNGRPLWRLTLKTSINHLLLLLLLLFMLLLLI